MLNRNRNNRIRFEMPACWKKVISQILPKIGCHGNVPWEIKKWGPDRKNSRKYLSYCKKSRENRSSRCWDIIFSWFKRKKKFRKVKLYSPVGKFAERAKTAWAINFKHTGHTVHNCRATYSLHWSCGQQINGKVTRIFIHSLLVQLTYRSRRQENCKIWYLSNGLTDFDEFCMAMHISRMTGDFVCVSVSLSVCLSVCVYSWGRHGLMRPRNIVDFGAI